jgi:CheY-like chemotaxis protein
MSKTYSRHVSQSEPGVIVVADDDPDILDLVALTLERSGHVVHRALDGEEALELIERERPDLVVLDISMPKLDGLELTRRLCGDPETKAIRIVLLTALVQDTDISEGLAAGADAYVRKPFSPQELQERVATLLPR